LNVIEFTVYLKNTGTVILFALITYMPPVLRSCKGRLWTVQDFSNISVCWFCCSRAYFLSQRNTQVLDQAVHWLPILDTTYNIDFLHPGLEFLYICNMYGHSFQSFHAIPDEAFW